ncbi:protein DpdD [Sphingopyxis macrogoltabida]|uniref:protein DpdD n=1 Tax=Sphingopyxis macrogoltabida TaxID=33050 RepID=UPI0007A05F51|nr:protein DpdD [Sphingopyxis macrogoltabida]
MAEDEAWLSEFFSDPNELHWASLRDGTAPPEIAEQVLPWLLALADSGSMAPVILPFVRAGKVAGWYATTRSGEGGFEFAAELQAWLGPTYLSLFEQAHVDSSDPSAMAIARRSNGRVWKFSGANGAAKAIISRRLDEYCGLLRRRPKRVQTAARPVGTIRGDFERALLAKDAAAAEGFIAELKTTGRLNEENLRYLTVRLSAGLGLWPEIARNHWLVQTMSDLALPPRILADIIEALYRTYVDAVEAAGDVTKTLATFDSHVAGRYPRLFASRRGIRTPRVVKAFLLFEQLQSRPNGDIIDELGNLLEDSDKIRVLVERPQAEPVSAVDPETEADEIFDDLQYDRAFSLYTRLPLTKKIIGRLITCAQFIGTEEARARLISLVHSADPELIGNLAPPMRDKLHGLSAPLSPLPFPELVSAGEGVSALGANEPNGWMAWAEKLRSAEDLSGAEQALQTAVTNWTTAEFKSDTAKARAFADIIGNLNGEAAMLARRAVPQIFESFFPADELVSEGGKPVAELLFALVAMDDGLSTSDLDILAQLLNILLALGLSGPEYVSIVSDLEDVQDRVRSYANLPWSLDVCEILAVSPAQSDAAGSARQAFFLRVLGQAQTFAHRLGPQDFLPMEFLAKDFGLDSASVDILRRKDGSDEAPTESVDLTGKLIGVYTLAEAAGARAKASLEKMFPGSVVEVNSDLVATDKLRNLARSADIFVFTWKSSSHAAFYCIKDELPGGEPIWAAGKGTASIIRAVIEKAGEI